MPYYPQYYIPLSDVRMEHLIDENWSARVRDTVHSDIAWTYEYPMPQVAPIAGLIAFYNEIVDTFLDGDKLPKPHTHFV